MMSTGGTQNQETDIGTSDIEQEAEEDELKGIY